MVAISSGSDIKVCCTKNAKKEKKISTFIKSPWVALQKSSHDRIYMYISINIDMSQLGSSKSLKKDPLSYSQYERYSIGFNVALGPPDFIVQNKEGETVIFSGGRGIKRKAVDFSYEYM